MDGNRLSNDVVTCSDSTEGLNVENAEGGVREVPMYSGQLLVGLNQLRQQEELCDVVLKVDAFRIHAHRVVLASCSPYFMAMFTGSLCEREKEEIELKSVDEAALNSLVEFAYTGKIRITHANVQALLPAANLLQLRCVKKLCCDFLQSQLHATNCIGISRFSDQHACSDLHTAAQKFISHHFEELSESEEFCLLEYNELADILRKDELIVASEESVFDALHTWVNYDPNKRQGYMAKLLHCIRLPLMTLKSLRRLCEINPFIQQNSSCQDQVKKAVNYHLRPNERLQVAKEMGESKTKVRGEAKMLCAVGGKNGLFATLDSVEVYHLATDTWKEVAPLNSRSQECTAAVVNKNLYVIGGIKCQHLNGSCYRSHENGTERWCPDTNKWTSVSGMHKCRSNHGVAVLNGKIWVLGGYNGESYLRSVECYCPKRNSWKMVSPMIKSRSIFNAAVVDGKLYAIGGYGPNYLNSVERYDPEINSWEMVSPMADKRINFGVGVLNGFVYVVGGHNGTMHLSSVERYDPHLDAWTTVTPMDMARTGLGVATMDGILYAAGGHSGSTYLDRVECYNPYEDKWTVIKPMLNSRCNFALAGL